MPADLRHLRIDLADGAQCPSLAALVHAALNTLVALTPGERDHLRGPCARCERILTMAWSDRPAPQDIAERVSWWPEESAAVKALASSDPLAADAGQVAAAPASVSRRRSGRRRLPKPGDYRRIGLAASESLRRGPMSPLARLVRELTPYVREHEPEIYAIEGSFRAIVTHGLLRDYPHLYALPAGRLGGLIDVVAATVGSAPAAVALTFGDAAPDITRRLKLDLELDLIIYLVDPRAGTSIMPETLENARRAAIAQKPFLATYASASEWFSLLGHAAGGDRLCDFYLPPELSRALDVQYPRNVIGLVASDSQKQNMIEWARDHVEVLGNFNGRIATAGTASVLNGVVPEHLAGDGLVDAVEGLSDRLAQAGVDQRAWVTPLRTGPQGGGAELAEAVAMGLCDTMILFEGEHVTAPGAQLFERAAMISNQRDGTGGPREVVCLQDRGSAAAWAELYAHAGPDELPTTVMAAFRRLFDVDLVLADPADNEADQWQAIAIEAAWYLAGAIAARSVHPGHLGTVKRVTVCSGAATCEIINRIDDAAGKLCERIHAIRRGHAEDVTACKQAHPQHARLIDHIARKELDMRPAPDNKTLWSMPAVTVAPMVGAFASADHDAEPNANAKLLARYVGGTTLPLDTGAFAMRGDHVPTELREHFHSSDVVLMTATDLADGWFERGRVSLPDGMYDDLAADGAVGEIAGLYLDAEGREVQSVYRRQGMSLEDIQAVARGRAGRAAILVGGAHQADADGPPRHARAVLAALRAGAASVLVSDLVYATKLLEEHARQRALEEHARQRAIAPK